LISQGQATRSTLTYSRVIHFMMSLLVDLKQGKLLDYSELNAADRRLVGRSPPVPHRALGTPN
jgi:hypothetical protein